MSADRELLELAAKAAGLELTYCESWCCMAKELSDSYGRYYDNTTCWNPLTDDGDALRLAVKLRLTPMMRGLGCDTTDSNGGASAYERWGAYPFAAARRAIVRAAAEIGRQMQNGGAA